MALFVAAPARAERQRVVVVRPQSSDSTILEAAHRIRGELKAEGFEVTEVDTPPASDDPDSVGGYPPSIATIALAMVEGTHVAELRVIDRLTHKVVIRRDPVGSEASGLSAEVLAVRAVELLRASLLELLVAPAKSAPPQVSPNLSSSPAAAWAAGALAPEPLPEWGVEAGVTVLGDFGGIPPAVLALARLRRRLTSSVAVRATIEGLGTSPRIQGPEGSATVTQQLGLLEVVATPGARWPVRPVLSIGGGAAYVEAQGQSDFPYEPRRSAAWRFAYDCGAGGELPLGGHLTLSLEGHLLGLVPYPVVTFLGADVAKTGQPSVAGSLSIVGWL